MIRKHALAIACCAVAPFCGNALAADTPPQTCLIAGWENPASICETHNRTLASTCFNCHGPNGVSNSAIPGLAGQDKAYIVEAMKAFRKGERESTVMKKYALGYTDAEYEALAALFATMQINLADAKEGQK
ncbi:MAG: cytochrome C [Pseudomonadota bacterium]